MKPPIIEKENSYILSNCFGSQVTAGFTKHTILGKNPSEDIKHALGFLNKKIRVAYMQQKHSTVVNSIDTPGEYEGDGLLSKENNLVLTVKTADCLPIILYSKKEDVIGVIHMGWRSAKGNIINNINYDLSTFKALCGVGLRKCCYEVGSEFLGHIEFKPFIKKRVGKLYFDPIGFAKNSLIKKGLKKNNFFDVNICSLCSGEQFFSYRKTGLAFRTLSFIVKN